MEGHPPKLALLIAALRRVVGGDDDPGIEQLANKILWEMNMLAVRYAEMRRTTKAGPARDLRDLKGAARKAAAGQLDIAGWAAAWARVPEKTLRRIWRPKVPPIVSRKRDAAGRLTAFRRAPLRGVHSFRAPGLHMLVPKPEEVLAAIKSESERTKQMPGDERRKRKRDEAEHAAIEAIRSAYRDLTGKKGGRAIDASGNLTGRMFRLGREIDAVFGTQLFAAKDSRRLR